ncbi:hypothetical protein AN189_17655 [Loktanella sp. 3ANDIMAR09]|nr:hypothetical protein AN189_17655 [Loktanella sp. 3ANDIMAR09]
MAKEEPEMPDVGSLEYLTEWLAELDFCQSNGAIVRGVPHTEVKAWAENTGVKFHGQEAAWLVAMSRAYAAEVSRSDNKNADAPFEV